MTWFQRVILIVAGVLFLVVAVSEAYDPGARPWEVLLSLAGAAVCLFFAATSGTTRQQG